MARVHPCRHKPKVPAIEKYIYSVKSKRSDLDTTLKLKFGGRLDFEPWKYQGLTNRQESRFGRRRRPEGVRAKDGPSHKSAGKPIWTPQAPRRGEGQGWPESLIGRKADLDAAGAPQGRGPRMARVNRCWRKPKLPATRIVFA